MICPRNLVNKSFEVLLTYIIYYIFKIKSSSIFYFLFGIIYTKSKYDKLKSRQKLFQRLEEKA